jgi:hypothetical protein
LGWSILIAHDLSLKAFSLHSIYLSSYVLLQNVADRFAKCTIPELLGLSGHAAGSKLPAPTHGLSVPCGSCMISN